MSLDRWLKRLVVVVMLSGLFLVNPSLTIAADGSQIGSFTGNVGWFSEYRFRGLDQSGDATALQGGLDWAHDSGFYFGTWGSNVDFNDNNSTLEADIYGGYATEFSGVSVDLSMIGYVYPGSDSTSDYDFLEYAIGLGYGLGPASFSFGFNHSGQFYAGSGEANYYSGGVDYEAPLGVVLSAHVGRQTVEFGEAYGANDYMDWSFGASYAWQGFDLSVTYIDTDIGASQNDPGDDGALTSKNGTAVLGISRSF